MGVALKREKIYTYADYLSWSESERWEIIDGRAYDMSPAPSVRHQDIVGNFYLKLKTYPKNRCYVGIAPTDVVLDEHNVLQPDCFMVCDKGKVTERCIEGAPDLVIEVVSPSTELKDRREKKAVYERFGVREYTIIFPEREYCERYCLNHDGFGPPEIFNWDEELNLCHFDIKVSLYEIFDKELREEKIETMP